MDARFDQILKSVATQLLFAPEHGHITFDNKRVALIHTSLFGRLTGELVNVLGIEKAGTLLTEIGYYEGAKYENFAPAITYSSGCDRLAVGLNLHAISGMASVETITLTAEPGRGKFYAELLLKDSFEAKAYRDYHGMSSKPVCWIQVGHLSAFASKMLNRSILFKEMECQAMGHAACRVVGRPMNEWGNKDDPHFRVESIPVANAFEKLVADKNVSGKNIVGGSPELDAVLQMLRKVAPTDATVLLMGETGVGKELFAREIHSLSSRRSAPFVAVNCGALSKQLLEAEMFGVERGAYTGATDSRPGRFERANHGTLFLDEIATLDLESQVKLLRALQEGEVERVGDTRVRKVDVRVIAATNVDLRGEVEAGRFRDDLYFRLSGFPLRIPPLRKRRDDIPLLVNYFLPRIASSFRKKVRGLTDRAIYALMEQPLPGNVRELQHWLERGVILAEEDDWIDLEHVFPTEEELMPVPRLASLVAGEKSKSSAMPAEISRLVEQLLSDVPPSLKSIEEMTIGITIAKTKGNVSQAAKLLGLSRAQLIYRLRGNAWKAPKDEEK
ncbi:MAG: AAA family ATPase [Rugosibacter sp.]|nr:MAG: AAA family ATPase [Rugosibacter sp.]